MCILHTQHVALQILFDLSIGPREHRQRPAERRMQGIAHLNPRGLVPHLPEHCGLAARIPAPRSSLLTKQHRRQAFDMAATSEATQALKGVFPESHLSLKEADPEAFAIIEQEKERQWCATRT